MPDRLCTNFFHAGGDLTSVAGKASLLKGCAKIPDGVCLNAVAALERGGVHKPALQGPCLAHHALHQHSNGHTGWEGVRVDEQIRPAGPDNALPEGAGTPAFRWTFKRTYRTSC